MIELTGNQLALNSFDVPGYEYSMWTTWKMPKSATARDVVYWIGYACDQSPDLYLKHVVINSHGNDGGMAIGKDNAGNTNWIYDGNVELFSKLKSKSIGTIWFVGCLLAATTKGQRFCKHLAINSGCDVVAATTEQEGWNTILGSLFMPSGNIDDFEGKVYRFSPAGGQERFQPNGGTC
jgi:hypothetical protein